jgi:hypothetical protein
MFVRTIPAWKSLFLLKRCLVRGIGMRIPFGFNKDVKFSRNGIQLAPKKNPSGEVPVPASDAQVPQGNRNGQRMGRPTGAQSPLTQRVSEEPPRLEDRYVPTIVFKRDIEQAFDKVVQGAGNPKLNPDLVIPARSKEFSLRQAFNHNFIPKDLEPRVREACRKYGSEIKTPDGLTVATAGEIFDLHQTFTKRVPVKQRLVQSNVEALRPDLIQNPTPKQETVKQRFAAQKASMPAWPGDPSTSNGKGEAPPPLPPKD